MNLNESLDKGHIFDTKDGYVYKTYKTGFVQLHGTYTIEDLEGVIEHMKRMNELAKQSCRELK